MLQGIFFYFFPVNLKHLFRSILTIGGIYAQKSRYFPKRACPSSSLRIPFARFHFQKSVHNGGMQIPANKPNRSIPARIPSGKIVDVTLLPNEKINKTRKQRSAVFDLHCKDSDGNRFIIEVQISKQDHFIGRLLFYISQTISGLAKKGKKYNFNYPRVFSLSFLNFEPEPEEKSRKVVEHIGLVNLERSKKQYPHIHIALVMLTRFKKKLEECKTTCDLWLYLFKNLHKMKKIPPKFRSKRWRSVFDVAEISNFNEIELRDYEANMKYCNDYENTIEYAGKEGEARGEARGIVIGESRGEARGMDKIFALWEKGVPLAEAKRRLKRASL